ncbi:MAG: hypothetical protein PQ964_08225 [Methanobacteriaceae archaeon]|jgi:hypothetical protein
MVKISVERDEIIKSLNGLENEFKKGNVPKSHYEFQKRQLTGRLRVMEAAERVMRLRGKKITEAPVEALDEGENDELFRKYITSPGLREKNIESNKGTSQSTMIAAVLLIIAFVVGIGSGIHILNVPGEVPNIPLYANNTTSLPSVLNNATNITNITPVPVPVPPEPVPPEPVPVPPEPVPPEPVPPEPVPPAPVPVPPEPVPPEPEPVPPVPVPPLNQT